MKAKATILSIIFLLHVIPAFANNKLSTEVAGYFFKPIKMEKISGTFNGFYKVLPGDDIAYEEVAFFDNKEYPMRYYSNSLCMKNKKCNGSIISIFDQKFYLGTINNTEDAYIDIHLDSTWWLLNLGGQSYICSLAAQRGASAYSFIFLIFDITNKHKIKFSCLDTFAFDDVPLIGSLPDNDGQLYFLRTVVKECFVTTPYAITNHGLVEYKKTNGVPYSLKFEWNKWKSDEIKIIKLPRGEETK